MKTPQNLSKNDLGHDGAVAVGELLDNDNDLLYLDLSGELNAAIVMTVRLIVNCYGIPGIL